MEDNSVGNQNTESNNEPEKVSKNEQARRKLRETERIDALRARLYARGKPGVSSPRHALTDPVSEVRSQPGKDRFLPREKSVTTAHNESIDIQPKKSVPVTPAVPPDDTPPVAPIQTDFMPQKKHSYRLKIVLAGVVFFVATLGLSATFLFYSPNTISGDNISIDVSGPLLVGGGEEMPIQISIANQNTLPIESATLIIEYPPGTQSSSEPGKELYSDRQQLNNIGTGEVVNIPIRAVVFGEENEERMIHVSVEYRVRGSNATFYKEAEPLRFKISSSPIVLSVDTVRSITSGQETEIELSVRSNAQTELTNILIKASYPFGFDFTRSEPDTVTGQDTWFIESLEPEEVRTILIKGIVVGKQDEERIFEFSAGVPNERDRFNLASVFTNIETEMTIEQPFLGIDVAINGDESETVAIGQGKIATVAISFTNALEDTIYDGIVTAELDGNALDEVDITVNNGFYDSNTNTITWDSIDEEGLIEIAPGKTSSVRFGLRPADDVGRTPEIKLKVTVKGQRVFEDRVPQELVGSVSRVLRIESETRLTSSALYTEGPFINTGPTPPVAEEVTQYSLFFALDNGSNDITGAEMTAILPQYITWLDLVTPGDDVTYNATTRVMTWDIGDMDANEHEEAWVQVSFLPSFSQVKTVPTIIESQRFRATDRFTGTVLRDDAPALTTALRNDPDTSKHNGRVVEE